MPLSFLIMPLNRFAETVSDMGGLSTKRGFSTRQRSQMPQEQMVTHPTRAGTQKPTLDNV
jgi:hypothetical protein